MIFSRDDDGNAENLAFDTGQNAAGQEDVEVVEELGQARQRVAEAEEHAHVLTPAVYTHIAIADRRTVREGVDEVMETTSATS